MTPEQAQRIKELRDSVEHLLTETTGLKVGHVDRDEAMKIVTKMLTEDGIANLREGNTCLISLYIGKYPTKQEALRNYLLFLEETHKTHVAYATRIINEHFDDGKAAFAQLITDIQATAIAVE